MRNFALLGASALTLALGVAGASAEPFNPTTNSYGTMSGPVYGYGPRMNEGRAAYDGPVPYFGIPTPFVGPDFANAEPSSPGSVILQQFHEGK